MKETRFKDTEVGRIPVDWEVKPLAEVGTFSKGAGISRAEASSGNIPAIRYGEIYTCHNDYIKSFYSFISKNVADTSARIFDGDILFAASGETKEDIGKCVAYTDDKIAFAGGDIIILHSNRERFDSKFCGYALNAKYIVLQKSQRGQGDAVVHIVPRDLATIAFAFPPKSEQTRIAAALSNVDALISELGKLIEKKRAIKQGAMQQLLTGKKRLKGFTQSQSYYQTEIGRIPDDWEIKKVNDIADNYTGLTYSPDNVSDFGTLVLRSSNIQDCTLCFIDNVFVDMVVPSRAIAHEGNVLICVRNGSPALIGKCAYITQNADGMAFGAFMTVLRATHIDQKFLYYIWQDVHTQKQIHETFGATINQITAKDFDRILIALPTNRDEQSAIASILSSMDEEISALETKRNKYTAIKQGMMQQLLTGKIRLVETAIKTNATSANVHFRRSVLAAEIADRLCEEPTFGHVKMEKILFLTERLCHIDIGSHYHRDAAGPYDNRALRSIDSQLKRQKWFEVRRTEKGNRYAPMQNRGKHKTYFEKYYSDVLPTFDKIIDTFKTHNTERCEIVATLYSAWEDLLHSNKSFTDAEIVNEVLNNWHESKKRISQDRWLSAIQWMREHGFAPDVRHNESRK